MHEIPLNLVKPSPNPIRKTWDEDKMQELAQSIKEQGVIVPIKVRPPDDINPCRAHGWGGVDGEGNSYDRNSGYSCEGCLEAWTDPDPENIADLIEDGFDPFYKVVYGHRRIEAARRAGLDKIPAIVEGVEDTDALIQALIENLQREDMGASDKGGAILDLQSRTGWTYRDMQQNGIASPGLLSRWVMYYRELQEGMFTIVNGGDDSHVMQVIEAKTALKDDTQAKQDVVSKAIREELNYKDTRAVADAYAAADTPELKQAILDTSGKLGDADRITQVAEMKVAGRNVADGQEVRREKAFQEFDSAVKDFLDSMKMFDRMIAAATKAAKYGKFSPEAKPFTVRKIDRLIDELESLKEALSNG